MVVFSEKLLSNDILLIFRPIEYVVVSAKAVVVALNSVIVAAEAMCRKCAQSNENKKYFRWSMQTQSRSVVNWSTTLVNG